MALNIQLPQQEVILPVTGRSARVYPLTLRLKSTILESEILTMSERFRFICEVVYDRLVNKDDYGSFENFLNNIYEKDLLALVYGIIKLTYREPYPFRRLCPHCGKIVNFEIPLDQIITKLVVNDKHDTFYSDVHLYEDPELGLHFQLKLPTMSDLIKTLKFSESLGFNLLSESVKADSLEELFYKSAPIMLLPSIVAIQDKEGHTLKNDLNNPSLMKEVLNTLQELPSEYITSGVLQFLENLRARYTIEFGFKAICPNPSCESNKQKIYVDYEVDILSEFFPIPIEKLLS